MATTQYPARTLVAVSKVVDPRPLTTREELEALYRSEVNAVRGEDIVRRMKLELEDALFSSYYKAFVMGHSGVGKSTEMNRLFLALETKYRPIRFSALQELDAGNFEPYDVLLLLVMRLIEEAAKKESEGGIDFRASRQILQPLLDWLADEKVTSGNTREGQVEGQAGVGASDESFWAKVLGVFASTKGELRYSAYRSSERVEYRLRRLSELVKHTNALFAVYRQALRDRHGQEWLVVGEDFDKPKILPALAEKLFLHYGSLLNELECHLIFSIPVSLVYSQKAQQLPFGQDRIFIVPDTPVFDRHHQPHEAGRAAVRAVLSARVDPALFEPGQMERLIIASGGNLRDLLAMVREAALQARVRESAKMGEVEVDLVIQKTRVAYERRLGESPFDPDKVTYQEKAERLVAIYEGKAGSGVPDPVLHSLLLARAVQEFNGARWFGVHPLVADYLIRENLLPAGEVGVPKTDSKPEAKPKTRARPR